MLVSWEEVEDDALIYRVFWVLSFGERESWSPRGTRGIFAWSFDYIRMDTVKVLEYNQFFKYM